jgi:GH25 family lysozyme M1 (1,4-beta-N-acetylmuramidase)
MEVDMSTSPSPKKKGRHPRKKYDQTPLIPLLAALAAVCALLGGIAALEPLLSAPESTVTTLPVQETLPPNAYAAADFVYENGYLHCVGGEYSLGIDVSSHQKHIEWEQVAASGMEFAMVRIGYRGYSEGLLHIDETAAQNLTGAKAAGLKVGAYFYSQAINTQEAAQEAALCVDFLKDHRLDLPMVYDWEYVSETARTANMDPDTLTQCALVFCQAIEKAGYEAMIYANPSQARDLYHMSALQDYRFWLALYDDTMDYPYHMDMWQYTNTGSVPGIAGNVDINLLFHYG